MESVTFDARDPRALGQFWADALGWRMSVEDDGEVDLEPVGPDGAEPADPVARYPQLVFVPVAEPEAGRERVHLDLATESVEHQQEWVGRLLALGATHGDVGQPPDAPFTVLTDPEGNNFCVLDPRPEYGEPGSLASIVLAAHDAPALKQVWAAALGWELIRDEPDWITFQRPDGKGPQFDIITRPTLEPRTAKNRSHIDVRPAANEDQSQAVARLEAAGARQADIGQTGDESWVVLADPEDNELCVLSPRD